MQREHASLWSRLVRVKMLNCRRITDAACVHLCGIQSLSMQGRTTITDAAFVHLHLCGIRSLETLNCRPAVTAAAAALLALGQQ